MTGQLTVLRDHLVENRRMILGRSIAAAIAGAVPVPILDSRLSYIIQRGTLRRLAGNHQVDLDEEAAQKIIFGETEPPRWAEFVGSTLAIRILSRAWRKALVAYFTARRAQVAGHYFAIATLFDHYCAKLHVGLGLDRISGAQLRAAIDEALEQTPGSLSGRLFRRALLASVRASARAPLELLDIVSRGAIGRLLAGRSEDDAVAVEEVESHLERQLRSQKSFLARAATAVELQLAVEQNPYLDGLIDNFERIWRRHQSRFDTGAPEPDAEDPGP